MEQLNQVMGIGYPVFNEEAPWLYACGWGLLLSSPVLPPCWCPAGPITLYQEAAAAASLALVCLSFPLVSWATFSSGCLGNQPLLLPGEEGPSLAKNLSLLSGL